MYVYICIDVYLHTGTHTYIYIYTHFTNIHICIHLHTHTHTRMQSFTYIPAARKGFQLVFGKRILFFPSVLVLRQTKLGMIMLTMHEASARYSGNHGCG
jgi:hypothetical protein